MKEEIPSLNQVIDYGYYVFLSSSGPMGAMPVAWFAYEPDAKDWADKYGSADYPCAVKPNRFKPARI